MDSLIVTTVSELDDLANVISTLDDDRNDSAARIRLCDLAHRKIQAMLGAHVEKVYGNKEE